MQLGLQTMNCGSQISSERLAGNGWLVAAPHAHCTPAADSSGTSRSLVIIISRYAVLLNTFQINTSCPRRSSSSEISHPYSPSPMNCDMSPYHSMWCHAWSTHFVLEYLNCLRTRLGMRKRCLGPKGSICTFGSMRAVRGSESLAHAPSGNNARLQRPLLPTTEL